MCQRILQRQRFFEGSVCEFSWRTCQRHVRTSGRKGVFGGCICELFGGRVSDTSVRAVGRGFLIAFRWGHVAICVILWPIVSVGTCQRHVRIKRLNNSVLCVCDVSAIFAKCVKELSWDRCKLYPWGRVVNMFV